MEFEDGFQEVSFRAFDEFPKEQAWNVEERQVTSWPVAPQPYLLSHLLLVWLSDLIAEWKKKILPFIRLPHRKPLLRLKAKKEPSEATFHSKKGITATIDIVYKASIALGHSSEGQKSNTALLCSGLVSGLIEIRKQEPGLLRQNCCYRPYREILFL